MELKIMSDSNNALLNRREIQFYILADNATPSRESIKVELCKKLSLSPEATIVVKMDQGFGIKRCECMAHSYKDETALKKQEPKHIQERLVKKEKSAEPKLAKSGATVAAPKNDKK